MVTASERRDWRMSLRLQLDVRYQLALLPGEAKQMIVGRVNKVTGDVVDVPHWVNLLDRGTLDWFERFWDEWDAWDWDFNVRMAS